MMDEFLHAKIYSGKPKVTLIAIGWEGKIWVYPFKSWDSIINLLYAKNELIN